MKKLIALLALTILLSAFAGFAEEPMAQPENWELLRAEIAQTEKGIEVRQTEVTSDDNHAIAIYKIPFTRLDQFEITFRIEMDDFVASGRNANDVWASVNLMGVPRFFNWRNSEKYGYAKDTPGLVTRFFSYDCDLRLISDIYHGGYRTSGDDASSMTVDTWTLLNTSAQASLSKPVTMKFAYEKKNDTSFYQLYVNGKRMSDTDQLAFIKQDVLFPSGELFLSIVMNTQDKPSNMLSTLLIESINGVDLARH